MDSKNPSGAKSRAEVYDWIQCIIFALVFCVLLFVFAVRMVNVVGHSMVPTLEQSDLQPVLLSEAGGRRRPAQADAHARTHRQAHYRNGGTDRGHRL